MKRLTMIFLATQVFGLTGTTFAYEVETHEELSKAAASASRLKQDDSTLTNLGLKSWSDEELFTISPGAKPKTISDLIQDGSKFEDALPGSRFVHHFYDPIHNIPLSPISLGEKALLATLFGGWLADPYKSPDWALEDLGDINVQEFSFKDARRALLSALTQQSKELRNAAFGFTFQTLGHIIHHIQDMAQPQHTRNEKHALRPENLYEHYTLERQKIRKDLPLSGYGPVQFDAARKFWTGEGKGMADFSNANFVTQHHNFTLHRLPGRSPTAPPLAGEIGPHPDYPSPNGNNASIMSFAIGNPDLGQLALDFNPAFSQLGPHPLEGKMYFVGTPITDQYFGLLGYNSLTSSFSVYDPYLTFYNLTPQTDPGQMGGEPLQIQALFNLNRYTFDAAHEYLLPRAVSYSAGLIDYFFRGKVEMCDGENADQSIIKNLSPIEDMKGVFELYYDDDNGGRHSLGQWATAAGLLPEGATVGLLPEEANGVLVKNGGEMRVTFEPPNPKPATYLLVFYGDMGEEKAPRKTDGTILPGGAVVAKQVDATKHCKGIVWIADRTSSSVLAYNLPDGRPLGSFNLPNVYGIAYDPTDGNLWYTTIGSNTIQKVTPTGAPVAGAFTVTGMIPSYDGQEPQILGLDADPSDPTFVWVAVSPIYSSAGAEGLSYVYKVRTTDGPEGAVAGEVEQQCQVPDNLEFTLANVGNDLVAVSQNAGGTVVLVSPSGGTVRRPLYMEQVGEDSCPPIASMEYFLTPNAAAPTGYMSGHLSGVETKGHEVIAVVRLPPTFTTQGVYTFGVPPSTTVLSSFPLSGDIQASDLAVGSSF